VSRQRIRAAITLAAVVAAAGTVMALVAAVGLSLTAADPQVKEQSQANGIGNAATTSTPPSTTEDPPPTTEPAPTSPGVREAIGKEIKRIQVNVGDCVESGDNTRIGKTACGSPDSTYRIIEKAPKDSPCPSDTDHQKPWGTEQSTLCLDIDWVIGGCMELTPGSPKRIDCTGYGTPNGARVVEIKHDTTDVNTCSTGDRGIVYQQRKFVVCVARL
jgi:hypothetical protein